MNRQTIKDRNQRTIGFIEDTSDGRQKALDRDGRLLGHFDPKRNATTDRNGIKIAQGNVLSGLIFDQR